MVPDSETEPRSNTGCWSILLLYYAIAELYGEAPAGLYGEAPAELYGEAPAELYGEAPAGL